MDEDDDDFLYGGQEEAPANPNVAQPTFERATDNGVVRHLEEAAQEEPTLDVTKELSPEPVLTEPENEGDALEDEDIGESSDEEDIEIIMEPQARSLDFRQNAPRPPPTNRTNSTSHSVPAKNAALGPSLTTEYTVLPRDGSMTSISTPAAPPSQASAAVPTFAPVPTSVVERIQTSTPSQDDGIDPSTLPPVTAPPSHPNIDLDAIGTMDGRPILDIDLLAMTDKPWRRPGSDISDYFNYGFDEISWEAYCYRRRDIGDLSAVLKTNVLNFSGMPEEQMLALPAEARQMVMTGASVMMNGGANPALMGPGAMMDMTGMMPMGMGMNGDMGMGGGMMPVQMQDAVVGQSMATGPIDQSGMMPDAFAGGMNMGMGDYVMPLEQQQIPQAMYQGMEATGGSTPNQPVQSRVPASAPTQPRGGRGVPPTRARGSFPARGRGGAGRPASPLPPGVPTGPRNQNKYKDRDGNAPAVEGLDYGGDRAHRTPSGEPEDRSSSRKRRSSPGLEDGRSSKRR